MDHYAEDDKAWQSLANMHAKRPKTIKEVGKPRCIAIVTQGK